MKILHITPTYYPATYWGGPIFSVYELNNALSSLKNVELKVLTTDAASPKLSHRLKVKDLENLYLNYEVIFNRRIALSSVSIQLAQKLLPLIDWADVVHLTATYSFPTIPSLLLCRIKHKPLVWSPRGAILDAYKWSGTRNRELKRIWEIICNSFIRQHTVTLHVTSEEEKLASLARIPRADAVIIPNGVDTLSNLPKRKWLPKGRLRIIFLGRLSPKKGLENLLRAMSVMRDDKFIELDVYGTGDLKYCKSLKDLAKNLGILDQSVQFHGHIDPEAKYHAFQNADLCVIPSYSENFCMVVAEALGHGVPVIASHGTPWQEVEKRGCGLWVENNSKALVDAIHVMRERDLASMGEKGWDWMKKEYSWEAIGNRMFNLYESLLS